MKKLRTQVGLVFQYPEYQLFEVDVLSDVCFGPKNQGLSKEECEKQAREALKLVGFPEKYYKQSPFELIRRTEASCGNRGSSCNASEGTCSG